MAQILVNINPREGFLDELNISFKGFSCYQTLDYKGFHFHCWHYHKTGHLLRDFPLPYLGKFSWRGKKDEARASGLLRNVVINSQFDFALVKLRKLELPHQQTTWMLLIVVTWILALS